MTDHGSTLGVEAVKVVIDPTPVEVGTTNHEHQVRDTKLRCTICGGRVGGLLRVLFDAEHRSQRRTRGPPWRR